MAVDTCGVCNSENREAIEADAVLAMDGKISWREVVRLHDLGHHRSVKNHMEKHWAVENGVATSATTDAAFKAQIIETVDGILAELARHPLDVQAALLVVVHNLRELPNTKASQQTLIAALKSVHEMSTMKAEQQLLLQFAATATWATEKEPEVLDVPSTEVEVHELVSPQMLLFEVDDGSP